MSSGNEHNEMQKREYLKDDFSVTARPWFWSQFWSQDAVIKRLAREEGRGPKTSLFIGPRGSGKTSAAKVMGMAACCEKIDELIRAGHKAMHCGNCEGCRQVFTREGMFHDGYLELVGDRDRVVEDIEEATAKVWYRKYHGSDQLPYVLAIDEAGFMPERAYRLLHKLSEEAPRVRFILIARAVEMDKFTEPLLDRVRASTFRFSSPSVTQSSKGLQQVAAVVGMPLDIAAADWISERVRGEPRASLGALNRLRDVEGRITLRVAKEILFDLVEEEQDDE